ncbi:MAG: 50S ribosomal protein L11 methyltransferase [Candidatus Omnitrophica bacterium]|nr:50S ribosomal protein L11 methyltransferase [Candidatus Omnitrophota bacterium]
MILGHKMMITDRIRTNAYQRAILEMVKEGDVVVDLGTGTGILAFFACQAGAKKVYAIEREEIIETAKEIARANGLEERIVFIKDVSTEVNLPKKVDVIVSELLGCFAIEENLLHFIPDARDRFLKPEGILIPSSVEMFLAPMEVSNIYKEIDFCTENVYGVNFLPVREMTINHSYIESVDPKGLLSTPLSIKKIDFYNLNGQPHLDSTVSFEVKKSGTLHGLVGWFEAQLSQKVSLSTAPDAPITHWKNTFFPIQRPITVKSGVDTIEVSIRAIPREKRIIWIWRVKVLERQAKNESLVKADFEHSTWRSSLFSKETLAKHSIDSSPSLNESGKVELFILGRCNGKRTVRQIAEELCKYYPQIYNNIEKAILKVSKAVRNHSLPSLDAKKSILY